MLPQFDIDTNATSFNVVNEQPSKTYKYTTEHINGNVDNVEAVKQTAMHILNTERYANVIYPDWYGMEFEKYVGRSFEYLQATLENDLKDALTQDDRIYNVSLENLEKIDIDAAMSKILLNTTAGDIRLEKKIGL